MMSEPASVLAAPVGQKERIAILDSLRGHCHIENIVDEYSRPCFASAFRPLE